MGEYIFFGMPYRWFELLDELNRIMKEMMAEQKARIAINNHLAQIKYAKKTPNMPVKPFVGVHIYYPIRSTKCNKVGMEQRNRRTTEKKYGKKLA